MNVVLLEPEIPPNTGNVARLCAATHSHLHLIEPFGFEMDDTRMKRAGMDYWKHVRWSKWSDWRSFTDAQPGSSRFWFVECNAPTAYHQVQFEPDDYLVFGRETAGLPKGLLETHRDRWIDIPMAHPSARSINLSNCVAIVLFEALRQTGFSNGNPAGR